MKIKEFILSLSLVAIFAACDKPEVGFFSYGGIRMQEDTLEVIRGIYQYSTIPMVDGSSRPLHFRIVQARDLETGKIVPELTEGLYEVFVWNEPFNALTDTTMEQVNRKRSVEMMRPVIIIENSGILLFNNSTIKFPVGKYGIDVEVSNTKGSQYLTNYCTMKLVSVPYKLGSFFRDRLMGVSYDEKGEKTSKDIINYTSYSADELEQIQQGTHPRRKITRVGESDIMELEMIIRDSEGTCISPKALKPVWLTSFFRNTYEVNSLALDGSNEKYTYTDTSAIYHFPTVPYPSFSAEYASGDYVPMTFYSLDTKYFTPTEAIKQEAADKGVSTDSYSFNLSNHVTFNEPGKWRLEISIPWILSTGKQ